MPRPTYSTKFGFLPNVNYFKPAGTPIGIPEEVLLGHDEVEAIRLKNLVGLSQEEAASQMGVSQPTFYRHLFSVHQKLRDAAAKGKAKDRGRLCDCNLCFYWPLPVEEWMGLSDEANTGKISEENQKLEGGIKMKVAITSIDGTLEGKVDERFGRARKIIVYDTDTKEHVALDNSMNLNAAQGAGTQAAQNVVQTGAKAIISGHFGPKAFQVIQMAGLEIYSATDMTVAEAIKGFVEGKLAKLTGADVSSHW